MAADDFFTRWSKRNAAGKADLPAVAPTDADGINPADRTAPLEPPGQPLPTMDDVHGLTHDSDYSRFVARGVDEDVKRSAMKKLFSDPRFNVMDGLDTYIDDYNTFEPIPPEMLHALNHAKTLLDPLAQLERPLMKLIDKTAASVAAEPVAGEENVDPEPSPALAPAAAGPVAEPEEASMTSNAILVSGDGKPSPHTPLSTATARNESRPSDDVAEIRK